ncbi:MAG TPA: XdhC family protein [Nitriliruptoraceae bacterium]|nr:XdhC family protein [Nitriliruptoraceae bacterium]
MDELQEVVAAAAELDAIGRPWALATIVSVAGSTYRRPGARLLVRDDNSWVGNLSGGCLEGEVLELGAESIDDGVLRRKVFDLTADEEAIWGWGLGCNGAMEVIVESAAAGGRQHLDLLDAGRRSGQPFRLVTVIGPEDTAMLGSHHLDLDSAPSDGSSPAVDGAVGGGSEADGVATADDGGDLSAAAVAAVRDQDRTTVVEVDGLELFVERATPPQRLLVCGAGHDAVPLVARAASLGWEVVVVDDRATFLTPERFPGASELVHAEPADAATATGADGRTAAVVMSHNFMRDADYLAAFAPVGLAYLGMLGPSQRLRRLVDHLATEDVHITQEHLAPVHGPAGLDLGAEGPDEIALAIVTEVMAATRGRSAGYLRERSGPIHTPPAHTPPGVETDDLPASWEPDRDRAATGTGPGDADLAPSRQVDH